MITPRRTSLIRVPDLKTFQQAIALLSAGADPGTFGTCVVIVPTRSAAVRLHSTLETLCRVRLKPDRTTTGVHGNGGAQTTLLTRSEWYDRMHAAAAALASPLGAAEREVLLAAAIREAIAAGAKPPFRIRPGLILEILSFYDTLRRVNRSVDVFERSLVADLEPDADVDRGALRLLQQTRFLAAAFRAYERRLVESDRLDEHALRERLLASRTPSSFQRVIITVGDRLCDPPGLWPADFDLLTRLDGLEQIDVVATENALAAGLYRRMQDWLPGIEERRLDLPVEARPVLVAPESDRGTLYHTRRDREEEIIDTARRIKDRGGELRSLNRVGIIVRRPLPYVYLAATSLEGAAVPFQSSATLPLAAEPFAAALNLVFDCVLSRFTRASLVALMSSPHFQFADEEGELSLPATAALNRALADAAYLGDLDHLARLSDEWRQESASCGNAGPRRLAAPAAILAHRIAIELEPLTSRRQASDHLGRLLDFLAAHEKLMVRLKPAVCGPDPTPTQDGSSRTVGAPEPASDRLARARWTIIGGIQSLREAHLRHGDPSARFEDVAAALKRWIEQQTFDPGWGADGVQLVDARCAPYALFDEVHVLGLVEGEWPERARPSIFYPLFLLNQLGWPGEGERMAALRAAFRDILELPRDRVLVSTFTLEQDDIVEPSTLLEQLEPFRYAPERVVGLNGGDPCTPPSSLARGAPNAPLRSLARAPRPRIPATLEEALTGDPPSAAGHAKAERWLSLRQSRTPGTAGCFHGETGDQKMTSYAITAVDQYLDCPFKYFATHVLKLQEDPEDEESMTAKTRGRFIHEVFRRFFEAWAREQGGTITIDNIDRAHVLFREVAESQLATLAPAEASLERPRLLGSAVAMGLGDLVLHLEAERAAPVVERLLEVRLDGEFTVDDGERQRRLRLTGTADRIDLLADGTMRLVDYKLGRGPNVHRAIQIPLYAVMASRRLRGHAGRAWVPGEVGYLAFGRQEFISFGGDAGRDLARELVEGQGRFLSAVEGIERGSFPPQPAEPFYCGTCPYSSVCRKDYVELEERGD